jgi:uncharacterized membrane protein
MAQIVYDGNPAQYEHLIRDGYEFRLGDYINRGIELFKQNIGGFVGFTLLYLIAVGGSGQIPYVGWLIQTVIGAPLAAGFFLVAHKIAKGEAYEFNDFFKGFDHMVQLVVGNLVMTVLVIVGLILLLLPGFYLAIAYTMFVPIVVFGRFEFWPALELSRKVVTKNWLNFFLLALVYAGIAILGILALGVGILAAIPVIYCISYAAYDDIFGTATDGDTFDDRIEEIGMKDADF